MNVQQADAGDVDAIGAVLRANAADTSLFQQPARRVHGSVAEFLVAREGGRIVGCAEVHHVGDHAEILAVAVSPTAHGKGVGGELVRACVERARREGAGVVWLATAKPAYFARFGFVRMSKWRLPVRVLLGKLWRIFEQPARRWLPALFGRHTFMRLP